MKALALLLVIAVAVTVVVLTVTAIRDYRTKRAIWRVIEKTKGKGVYLYLVKYGEEPVEVARVSIVDPDYEEAYTAAVFAAEQKAATMNANRKMLGYG